MTTLKIFKETNLYAASDEVSFVNTNGEDITAEIDALSVPEQDERYVASFNKSGGYLEITLAEAEDANVGDEATVIQIFWDDLTDEKQAEIIVAFGDNCNYDVFPIAEIPVCGEDDIDG